MTTDTVQILEANIQRAKEFQELGKALDRLEDNRDFKLLIVDGYIKNEAVRLVHLKADPAFQTVDKQKSIDKDIEAIGGLLSYFRKVDHQAEQAVKAIEADEAARDEILAEELAQ